MAGVGREFAFPAKKCFETVLVAIERGREGAHFIVGELSRERPARMIRNRRIHPAGKTLDGRNEISGKHQAQSARGKAKAKARAGRKNAQ